MHMMDTSLSLIFNFNSVIQLFSDFRVSYLQRAFKSSPTTDVIHVLRAESLSHFLLYILLIIMPLWDVQLKTCHSSIVPFVTALDWLKVWAPEPDESAVDVCLVTS